MKSIKNDLKETKYVWKKIHFKNEVLPISEYIHISTNHDWINKCQNALVNLDFYWEGYSLLCTMLLKIVVNVKLFLKI